MLVQKAVRVQRDGRFNSSLTCNFNRTTEGGWLHETITDDSETALRRLVSHALKADGSYLEYLVPWVEVTPQGQRYDCINRIAPY